MQRQAYSPLITPLYYITSPYGKLTTDSSVEITHRISRCSAKTIDANAEKYRHLILLTKSNSQFKMVRYLNGRYNVTQIIVDVLLFAVYLHMT